MKYDQTAMQKEWLKKILDPKMGGRNLYAYVYNCFGKKLYPEQIEALQAMLDPNIPLLLISFARQAGKTECIALYDAIAPAFFNNINIYTFGPKLEQAQISFERASTFIRHNKYNMYDKALITDKADRMKFSNGTQVRAVSASLNSEIEGLTFHVGILDESQKISSYKVQEAILPMGGATGAKIIQVGVPRVKGTHFHQAWKNPKYHKIIRPWKECEGLDKDYVMSLSIDPEIFATQYELRWTDASSLFLAEEAWARCETDKMKVIDEHGNISEIKYKFEDVIGNFWGIDFAKVHDATVIIEGIAVGEELYITNWWEMKGNKYDEQIGFIVDLARERKPELIMADKSSVGDAVIDLLEEKGLNIQGVNFDIHNKDRLYKDLRQRIYERKIHWPTKEYFKESSLRNKMYYKKFVQQCRDLEIEHKSSGLISVHHPEIGGAHDDWPDALALVNKAAAEYVPPNAYLA